MKWVRIKQLDIVHMLAIAVLKAQCGAVSNFSLWKHGKMLKAEFLRSLTGQWQCAIWNPMTDLWTINELSMSGAKKKSSGTTT